MKAPAVAATILRPLQPSDRDRVEAITRAVGLFRDDEIPVALEVFQATAAGTDTYEGVAAESDGVLVGWASWGLVPCTLWTFDLYWIVVDPACHGAGIGSQMLREMERRVAGRARMVCVETAGRTDYAATRAFYERHGYHVAATIPDYYAAGDDQVTFVKRLGLDGRRERQ
ncbi:MAG: Histone acetyltransferase [Gemmatimonadetes bacterium]|nr:Histone acetyltransferase [Gemmatimonadota bacterium]